MKTLAERELDILKGYYENTDEESLLEPYREEIIAIYKKFRAAGFQKGMGPYIVGELATAIDKLCNGQPITPLMGGSDEWSNCNTGFYINNRTSLVTKHHDNPYPTYENAIIWDAGESRFLGTAFKEDGTKVISKHYIKSFPFELKTFFIRVKRVKMTDFDGYRYQIVDDSDLERVFDYYQECPPPEEVGPKQE
jgi:hypothetical protein